MVDYLALSILSTSSRTRIFAFIAHARFVRGAVSIDNALWSTAFVWISVIFRQTNAGASSILLFANGIGAAR